MIPVQLSVYYWKQPYPQVLLVIETEHNQHQK